MNTESLMFTTTRSGHLNILRFDKSCGRNEGDSSPFWGSKSLVIVAVHLSETSRRESR